MRYRLVVTTCGRPNLLERTLHAFDLRVRPRPAEVVVVDDSGDPNYGRYLDDLLTSVGKPIRRITHPANLGFCETVGDALAAAAEPGAEWVYWLEDDFLHRRSFDLRDLAHVLERQPQVAQMALYRNPVSPEEKRAGGYILLHRGDFHRRGSGAVAWFEHERFWTTNPSLFRSSLAREWRELWPHGESECEGKFGIALREARLGTTFGVWGAGDPWVAHVGERSGRGY